MVTKVKTGQNRTRRRTKAFAAAVMGKPSGQILEQVKQATPEHFDIVSTYVEYGIQPSAAALSALCNVL